MTQGPRGTRLTVPLLIIAVLELLTYRLAAPVLRPSGDQAPGLGNRILENAALFLFHLATVLAALVLIVQVTTHLRRRLRSGRGVRHLAHAQAVAGVALALLALATQVITPTPPGVEILLEVSYAAMLALIALGALTRPGDWGVRIGVLLMSIPLLVHALGPIALRVEGDRALYTGLPETIAGAGRWFLILVASAMPYCFAPRPFVRSATRPIPLFVGAFVATVAAVVVRKHFEAGTALAAYGLGVNLGPGAPQHQIALAIMALGALTWTLMSCALSSSPARRRVGMGIGLVIVAGYGFNWPVELCLGAIGLLTVARAGRRTWAEEAPGADTFFRAPPIAPETWSGYVESLSRSIGERTGADPASVISRGQNGSTRSVVDATWREVPVRVEIAARDDSIERIVVIVGSRGDGDPAWVLAARPEKRLGDHPAPPGTRAPRITSGYAAFDRRFEVRDGGEWTAALFDDELRQRASATVDGWMAFWPGRGLEYCVHPGRGAPLDHPIPITELAFRGAGSPPDVERMVALLDALARIAARGLEHGTGRASTSEPSD